MMTNSNSADKLLQGRINLKRKNQFLFLFSPNGWSQIPSKTEPFSSFIIIIIIKIHKYGYTHSLMYQLNTTHIIKGFMQNKILVCNCGFFLSNNHMSCDLLTFPSFFFP